MTDSETVWRESTRKKYGQIDSNWTRVSLQRKRYLSAIDKEVKHVLSNSSSWLDVGSGDGARVSHLARDWNGSLVLVENSSLLPANFEIPRLKVQIVRSAIEDCEFERDAGFAVVSLLWNVLGHLENPQQVMTQLLELLSEDGVLIGDVNNYLNIRQYGALRVLKNILGGASAPKRFLTSVMEGGQIPVWLFSPLSIRRLARRAGYGSVSIKFFDYSSGRRASFLTGQIYFEARKQGRRKGLESF